MASPLSPHPLNTITTTQAGEPSHPTTNIIGQTQGGHVGYDIGFASIVLIFVFILIYTIYMCNRWTRSRSPPPPMITSDSESEDFHSVILSTTLEDDIMSNFPTFVYSDIVKPKPHKVDIDHVTNDAGCPICLMDYESVDVLRLLPECGHLFHMRCVDTWLNVHPTCPVCRHSPLARSSELT